MALFVILLYGLCLLWIFFYSMSQLHLVWLYARKYYLHKQIAKSALDEENLPFVTIQLPIYNELYVVEDLLNAVAAFDYPKDRFEIQVLDDSNDETVAILAAKVKALQEMGLQIEHIRRHDRVGFKAGALAYGMTLAKGEFIAIFDADFVPSPDFIRQCLPYFTNEQIGLVQARWAHINENYSLLTKLQALTLDAHFVVEQLSRNDAGFFINFNGTAGIWRLSCIESAGGWESDTLTEDLDLSYRAQLKGWKLVFVDDILAPAELPVAMDAVKSQQFRWTKGAAEVARKILWKVLRAPKVSFFTKLMACFHLINSSIFISVLIMSLVSLPTLWALEAHPEYQILMDIASVLFASFGIVAIFFWVAYQHTKKRSIRRFLLFFPTFLAFWAMSMAFSLHNSLAAIEGYIGKKSPFIRTPKFNLKTDKKGWKSNIYVAKRLGFLTYVEILFALYFLFGVVLAIYWQNFVMLPLHLALVLGYGGIVCYSILHQYRKA